MRVIALIDNADVIRRILEHLGRWAPRETRQCPRAPPEPAGGAGQDFTNTRFRTSPDDNSVLED